MSTLASVIVIDLSANRPAASIPGRLFFASDTGAKYRDSGAAWDVLTQAQTIAAVTHKFLTAFDAATGFFAAAQPAASDISGLAASATIDTTDAANISSGTLPAARLPNPSAATLGGVESKAAVAHEFVTQIGTDGSVSAARPADADLSVTDVTINDVSTSAHGFAPKAPNDATRFLDGTGAYSTPAGTGSVTHTGGALTADQPVFGAGGADTKAGTKSGNTDEVATVSGALTAGHFVKPDADGNLVDGGAAPLTSPIAESDVTGLATDLAARAAAAREINTTAPLRGGGDLSADRTLTIDAFTGDSGSGGAKGAVPAPAAGDAAAGKFIKADGTWAVPPGTGSLPASPADATKFLDGAATPAWSSVHDSDLSVSDITTNNVSTSRHGFAPKAPNDATKFLDGTGAYSVPPGSTGGISIKSADYALVSGDNAKLLVMNSPSPHTFTLPSPPPGATWNLSIANVGAGTLTVSRNSLNIDGAAADLTVYTGAGLQVFSDGVNYFTQKGMGVNPADEETPSGAVNGSNQVFSLAHTPNPAGSLRLFLNGVLLLRGAGKDYTVSGGTVTLLNATPHSAAGEWLRAWYRY